MGFLHDLPLQIPPHDSLEHIWTTAAEDFLGTLLEHFDKNVHSIDCHTPENRSKLP